MRFPRSPIFTIAVAACLATACGPRARQPNIIVISVDTLRSDRLPAYGYDAIPTPAIDGLSRDGILFEHAYTACPLTLPAHASVLTGLLPPEHGVRDNIGYTFDSSRLPSLGLELKGAGYTTGAFVSSFVLRAATGLGDTFDHYDDRFENVSKGLGEIERPGSETTAAALAWIEHQSEPFFAFVHLFEPHAPYEPPEAVADTWGATYDGEIVATDRILGEFIAALKARDLYDSSVIILLSDHGEGLGEHDEREHGILLYRSTLQVPLIVKLPQQDRAGERVAEPVHLIDVAATIRFLTGLSPGAGEGRSLLAEQPKDRVLYSETLYPRLHFGWAELRSVIHGSLHYISEPNPELFDLRADPDELRNIIADQRATATPLRQALRQFADTAAAPAQVDPDTREKLAALGYLTSTADRADASLDPRRHIKSAATIQDALDLAANGDHGGAVDLLSELVERYPHMLDARHQLASALQALGRNEEALVQYQQALQRSPVPILGILIEIARILFAQGEIEAALDHADLASPALPVESHDLKARIALARGDLETALKEAASATSAEPIPRPQQLLLLSQIQSARGDFDGALTTLDRLEARLADRKPAAIPWLYFERGEALARLGRNDEAQTAFRREISLYPSNVRAYERLAYVLAVTRRFEEIGPLLEDMAAAAPTRDGYLFVAQTAERLGDAEGARMWRQRALNAPENPS